MPVLNRAVETQAEIAAWRRKLHQNPELLYDVHETAQFVEDKLKSFGCDLVETGVGRTGVVGIIKGRHGDGPAIGLRADMDALPITETSGVEWVSQNPGKAHSCGHDGHTSMLLGAAQYLAETRNFRGSVALLFQPAEEGGAGGLAMVEDGVMDRFNISEVYGIHNMPACRSDSSRCEKARSWQRRMNSISSSQVAAATQRSRIAPLIRFWQVPS